MSMSRITKFALVFAIVTLIIGLSACDEIASLLSTDGDGGTVSYETMIPQLEGLSGEIPIGLVLSQTGPFTSSYGLPMEHGFKMALAEINNAQVGDASIKFIIEDDRGTIAGAVEAFDKLIHQDGVPVILGPTLSRQAREVFPTAQQNQVVAFASISAASGLSAIGDFNFRVNLPTDKLNPSGVKATQEKLGYQRVAMIYDESDLYSTDSDGELKKALTANGVEILTSETFQTGDTDFSAQLTRIKETSPDALFVSALNTEMSAIITQGRQILPPSVFFIVPDITLDEVQIAGPAAEGVVTFTGWFSETSTPGNEAFVRNYQATYGSEPIIWAAQSYTAVYILAEAIANAQSTDSTAIRDAMANTSDYDTILGSFSFDAVGDSDFEPVLLIVKNGQFEIFEEIDNVTPETHVIVDLPVESISVRILEIYPVQIDLVVEGILTDSCTTIYQTTQRREGDTVHVHITTKRPKDLACAAVISPIEVSVRLEGIFEPGKYKLIVNGVEELFEVF